LDPISRSPYVRGSVGSVTAHRPPLEHAGIEEAPLHRPCFYPTVAGSYR
jgi:hypothetical protein